MPILATRRCLLKLGLLLVPMPPCARAQEKPAAVVELFTSQGCSSCPPADALFVELAERDDLVVLTYHVDYWDYLGWKDDLATPENTARQRAYGEVFENTVYTPQAVVNGQVNVVGSDRDTLYEALGRNSGKLAVDVALSYPGRSIVIEIGGAATPADAHVILAFYEPRKVISIRRGENSGRTIDYRNIVTSFQIIGMWHGETMRLELPKSEIARKGGHCAVLLQAVDAAGRPGRILGAARASASW